MYATGDYAWLEPDGVVMYRGRRDDQVKIRGVRIELGEVETAIETHPDVRAACAVTANRTLHAFYTGVPIPARNLREYLRSRLPTAALPATLTHLDRMPISVNGKADRRALAALAEAGPEPEPASASLTEGIAGVIAQFWSDALGQPHLGASADFFELGGDSLVAARLCARISGRLNVHVPLVTVFQAPVLADFIEACVAAQGKAGPKL